MSEVRVLCGAADTERGRSVLGRARPNARVERSGSRHRRAGIVPARPDEPAARRRDDTRPLQARREVGRRPRTRLHHPEAGRLGAPLADRRHDPVPDHTRRRRMRGRDGPTPRDRPRDGRGLRPLRAEVHAPGGLWSFRERPRRGATPGGVVRGVRRGRAARLRSDARGEVLPDGPCARRRGDPRRRAGLRDRVGPWTAPAPGREDGRARPAPARLVARGELAGRGGARVLRGA